MYNVSEQVRVYEYNMCIMLVLCTESMLVGCYVRMAYSLVMVYARLIHIIRICYVSADLS